ncbi:unnamed protein product [Acanthoscelides obtectus]|uniref:Uncharacterized protein n=1 Tax=Acanthoscelides obtectus TaxID=200917 RepID=A0A9P0JPZ1_ACAOB|nr:unnamed protein product [Acanthoscelides obtectus]CAK1621183.1 hypothetical protein AOBTE_LOCUS819 [Acanthoscelides obtectus]
METEFKRSNLILLHVLRGPRRRLDTMLQLPKVAHEARADIPECGDAYTRDAF